METIKIAIVGYGNVGKGVHAAINNNPDMELTSIITRNPERTKKDFLGEQAFGINPPVKCIYHMDDADKWKNTADVAILCSGSKNDLFEPDSEKHDSYQIMVPIEIGKKVLEKFGQGPYFAQYFNTVDSFDTHARIPDYFRVMNAYAVRSDHTAITDAGWDPGIFSIERIMADAFLPESKKYTFWGKGVSQGHSDAIRQLNYVQDAIQYTVPLEDAVKQVRNGENPHLSTKDKHWRDCYVVLKKGSDCPEIRKEVELEIQGMPNYFTDYKTKVNFVSQEEMNERKKSMPHAGSVMTSGTTNYGKDAKKAFIEYNCKWDSNPEATGSILVACARACYKFNKSKKFGAYTMADLSPADYSAHSQDKLLKEFM
jgi:diaminopimelate dehydrogenase